jgi:hypothetical protein
MLEPGVSRAMDSIAMPSTGGSDNRILRRLEQLTTTCTSHFAAAKCILLLVGFLRSPPKQTAHFIHQTIRDRDLIPIDSGSDEAKKYVSMQNLHNTSNSLEALTGKRTFV